MVKKVIWAIVELVTIALGTGIIVTSVLERHINEDNAGIGAFMVVSGLLLKNWRKDLFSSSNSTSHKAKEKAEKNI
jgi:hypothetical protein